MQPVDTTWRVNPSCPQQKYVIGSFWKASDHVTSQLNGHLL